MKNFSIILLLFSLIGCKSKDLQREFAKDKISESVSQIKFKSNEIRYWGGWKEGGIYKMDLGAKNPTNPWSSHNYIDIQPLITQGIVRLIGENNFDNSFDIEPTQNYQSSFSFVPIPGDMHWRQEFVILNDWKVDNINITGIKTTNETNSIVEFTYSKTPINITPVGKILGPGNASSNAGTASFTLYDDGWRLNNLEGIKSDE